MEAVEEFMKDCSEFEIDLSREKLLLTQNPNGYLKRIAPMAPPVEEETGQ
jgi:cephalosporin hydroxylase